MKSRYDVVTGKSYSPTWPQAELTVQSRTEITQGACETTDLLCY